MTKEERWQFERDSYLNEYKHFYEAFGIYSNSWDMLYKYYCWYVWATGSCKKRIIAMYFIFEELVPKLKEYDITYYSGIDTFLKEWRDKVHGSLKDLYSEIEKEDERLNK